MSTGKPRPLNPQLEAAVTEFSDWWATRGRELDTANEVREPLLHYTDMRGMLGIITTEKMWFTSIFHLNDPSELGYGVGLAVDILRDEAERGDRVVKAFCNWMAHVLVKAGGEIFGFFVASFSRSEDDLGQWRAYADNGRGVAIGLAPKLFEVVADQSKLDVTEKTLAAHVVYDRDECTRNLREAIRRAVEVVVRGDSSVTSTAEREEFGKELARQLAVPLFTYAITSKHPAYAHERETRLLLMNDLEQLGPSIDTRTRGSSLVSYVPSTLRVRSPGAISKIVIGPAADDLADDAIRTFLRRQGLPLDIVQQSDIPYTAR